MKMITINYPEPGLRMMKEGSIDMIFDPLRKKWLKLTEEEWVRQNFVQYLVQVQKYPSTLIAIEKEIWLGELKKRFDILVYDKDHLPWMMIECKGQDVALNNSVLEQLLRYNISIPVPYLVITNGKQCYGWQKEGASLKSLEFLPSLE